MCLLLAVCRLLVGSHGATSLVFRNSTLTIEFENLMQDRACNRCMHKKQVAIIKHTLAAEHLLFADAAALLIIQIASQACGGVG